VSVYGLPLETFVIVVATLVAGSAGMVHYVVVHKLLGKSFPEIERGDGG